MSCPACRSARSRAAFEVRGHRFRRCRDCSSLFLERPPGAVELAGLYEGERYFANPDYSPGSYFGYRDYLADRPHIERKFARVLSQLEALIAPGELLDVGAGPGLLVAVARARGWSARGLDRNRWAAAHAHDELGVEVAVGTLEDAALGPASLDAVTMMDLIEHVPDPDALVGEAARVTRTGGAIAILTPDAGSPTTRVLGRRWPEVTRAPEHAILYSVAGLSALLARHGFEPAGWHWIGKTSSADTLAADLAPIAPRLGIPLARRLRESALAGRSFELDPRAKFCLYARRVAEHSPPAPDREAGGRAGPPRLPKRPQASVETAIREELEHLARADRLCDWTFEQFAGDVGGDVAEVGAGIGTFSARLLEAGAESLLALEPEPALAEALEERFGGDERVSIRREALPDAPALAPSAFDLVLCQNVLEHVDEDAAAMAAMAAALRPGGRLDLLVPAGPRLFGELDRSYGHRRRYDAERLKGLLSESRLELLELRPFNLLGVPGWWTKNRTRGARIGARALGAYEVLLPAWRPLERLLRPPWGLSLIVRARRPPG